MNCEQFKLRLDDYLGCDLLPLEQAETEKHVAHCQTCQARIKHAQAIQTELQALPAPKMRPGFAREAIAKATGGPEKKHHRRGFVAGFSTALAAGVALMAVIALLPNSMPENDISITQVAISLDQTQTVNLVFNSANTLEQATLTITLPDHVELAGLPGQRVISWQAPLKAGQNILPLPLRGLAQQQGELLASIEQGGKTKSIRVQVKVETNIQPSAMIPLLHSA